MTAAYWFALWAAVITSTAFAGIIVVLSDKLQDARHELARWRSITAGIVLDRVGDAEDAITRAEKLR